MESTKEKLLPGTATTHIVHGEKGFGKIEMLLKATGGLSLSQVCAVTGLEGSTIQNWVKRGWVAHPKGKRYEEIHIARVLIINALKECIKLENIAQLMTYVNGTTEDNSDEIIKENDLYNYLCSALQRLGQVDDLSQGGVESLVETAIKDYEGPTPYARVRIRKALTVMIYACVCTDVKRRTEAMMQQVLHELKNPDSIMEENLTSGINAVEKQEAEISKAEAKDTKTESKTSSEETRKTIAQALREWDLNRVESILNEDVEEDETPASADSPANTDGGGQQSAGSPEKSAQKPWYFRRN